MRYLVACLLLALAPAAFGQYPLGGSFVNFERALPDDAWARELDYMNGVSAQTLVVVAAGQFVGPDAGTACNSSDLSELLYSSSVFSQGVGKIDLLMSLAQARGMQVYVGSLQTAGAWDSPHLRACNQAVAAELVTKFGGNLAFAGFYFAQEVWLNSVYYYYASSPAIPALFNFVSDLSTIAPGRQVLAAPYFKKDTVAGIDGMTPSQTATALDLLLSGTGLKLVAPQDGIGVQNGAPPLSETGSYYAAMQPVAQNRSATLWSTLETFTFSPSVPPDKYPPASISRLQQQVSAEQPYTSKIITWMFGRDMSPQATYYPVEAYDLYRDYQVNYGYATYNAEVEYLVYGYNRSPAVNWPDTNGAELRDDTGGGYSNDPSWVGFDTMSTEQVVVTIDLGSKYLLQRVMALSRSETSSGIVFPQSMVVETSNNGNNYTTLGSFSAYPGNTSNFSIFWGEVGNSVLGQYLRLTFTHQQWMMLAEIRILGYACPPPARTCQ